MMIHYHFEKSKVCYSKCNFKEDIDYVMVIVHTSFLA